MRIPSPMLKTIVFFFPFLSVFYVSSLLSLHHRNNRKIMRIFFDALNVDFNEANCMFGALQKHNSVTETCADVSREAQCSIDAFLCRHSVILQITRGVWGRDEARA